MTARGGDARAFKVRDAASYDPVTGEFDSYVDRLSPPLVERLVALARLRSGEQVLDVGTGTGIVAFRAAAAVAPDGRLVGIDLSDGMVAAARAKAARAGVSDRVTFERMDAEALEFADASFDAVLSLFALLHFPAPLTALREMHRVLRPGGRCLIAVGSRPSWLSPTGLAHRVGRVPSLVRAISGRQLTAPGFLDALVRRYCPGDGHAEEADVARGGLNRTRSVVALLRAAGFSEVRWSWSGQEVRFDDAEEFWEVQRTFSSFARKRIAAASPDAVTALRREFLDRCRRVQARGGRLVYPYGALCVAARRPA